MKKTYVTWSEVTDQTHEIIRKLAVDNWKPDLIVGVARGGLYPALLLSNYLNVPMEIVKCQLRDGDASFGSTGKIGRKNKILLVDDINDTGMTLHKIRHEWGDKPRWGTHARVAVLVNNATSTYTEVDYSAETIDKFVDDQWVVFPWEDWWAR